MRILLLCLLLGACAHEPSLAGRWYGEDPQPGPGAVTKRLTHRNADGTYTVVFRRYIGNQMVGQQTESGRWSFSNGMYVTLTQVMQGTAADPADRHFHDIYIVESFEGDEMTYRHVATGRRFKAKRVADWP